MKVSPSDVRTLSQQEGLFDYEIAEKLQCSRVTVTRIRKRHDIPRPDLAQRKDKEQVCKKCGTVSYIRRCEHVRKYCSTCQQQRALDRKAQKREYMRTKNRCRKGGENK